VPINVVWQEWLERKFPSSVAAPTPAVSEKQGKGEKQTTPAKQEKGKISVRNTLVKFATDQTVGAAFNIPLFLAVIGATKGQSQQMILQNIQEVSFERSEQRERVGSYWDAEADVAAECVEHLHCGREAVAGRVVD
jgi:hypothetical protein